MSFHTLRGALVLLAALFLVACGSSGGSSNNTPSGSSSSQTSQAASSSSLPASSSSSSSTQTSSVASSSSSSVTSSSSSANVSQNTLTDVAAAYALASITTATNLGMSASNQSAAAPKLRISPSIPCEGGGTIDIGAGVSNTTMTFNNCTQAGVTKNGSISISSIQYNATYTSFSASYSFNDLTITDGTRMTYLNMTGTASTTISNNTMASYDATLSGRIEITEGSQLYRFDLSNYHCQMNNNAFTINGTIAISNDPDLCGANGTYTVTTSTPITVDGNGNVTGGVLVINGKTYTYNSNGTVTVDGKTVSQSDLQACQG